MPCTAAIVGFWILSIAAMTSARPGGFIGLPNSVMSAPAMKVRPAPVSTIASTLLSRGGLGEVFEHARAHFMLERVDGRIVDDDDGDGAVALHADWT